MEKKKKTEKLRKNKKIVIPCIILLFSLSLFAFLLIDDDYWLKSERILGQTSLFGEDLSGLDFKKAETAITALVTARANTELSLSHNGLTYPYPCAALGFPGDPAALCAYAEGLGREGNIVSRYRARITSLWRETCLDDKIIIDEHALLAVLEAIKEELPTTAEDAHFYIDDSGNVAIEPSKKGTFLDLKSSAARIRKALPDPGVSAVALIIADNADPDLTTADLEAMHVNGLLSSFTTYYNGSTANRAHNIALAASYFDLTLIPAGGSFSFNDTVGQRSVERGFLDAMIIENGEYVDGLGGGVCQVSTTVYGAVLRTELKVTARRPHSLVSTYVDPGQDAMVAWGTSDLAFENTYATPVLLHATAAGGVLTVAIYGDSAAKKEIAVSSEITAYIPYTTETIVDADLRSGSHYVKSPGKQGLECTVTRTISENGAVLGTETVSHDTYMAQTRLIVRGP